MTELQAAVLCAQLDELPAVLERQRAVRSRLRTLLEERGVRTVRSADPAGDSASHLILLADGPDHAGAIVARARAGGVLVRLVWNRPYYRHRVFERAGLTPENLGVARAARADDARRTIDLGLASPRAQVRKVALPVFAERVDRAEEVRRARDDPDRSIHRWAAELESRTAGPAPTTLP